MLMEIERGDGEKLAGTVDGRVVQMERYKFKSSVLDGAKLSGLALIVFSCFVVAILLLTAE